MDGTFEVSCVVPLQASASALHAAADRCDLEGVEWALASGADPSTREAEHGLTPLCLACGGVFFSFFSCTVVKTPPGDNLHFQTRATGAQAATKPAAESSLRCRKSRLKEPKMSRKNLFQYV